MIRVTFGVLLMIQMLNGINVHLFSKVTQRAYGDTKVLNIRENRM